jgi:hypothetical protein
MTAPLDDQQGSLQMELSITDWAKLESILWEAGADRVDIAVLVEQVQEQGKDLEDLKGDIGNLFHSANEQAAAINKLIAAVNSQCDAILKLAEALQPKPGPSFAEALAAGFTRGTSKPPPPKRRKFKPHIVKDEKPPEQPEPAG